MKEALRIRGALTLHSILVITHIYRKLNGTTELPRPDPNSAFAKGDPVSPHCLHIWAEDTGLPPLATTTIFLTPNYVIYSINFFEQHYP